MRRRSLAISAVAIFSLAAAPGLVPETLVPEEVPDRLPGVAERVERGGLVVADLPPRAPSVKTIDGDPSDWIGTTVDLAGLSHYDAGELLHTDFVWDAYGADAGEDIDRWNQFAGLLYEEERTERLDDVLRTLQMQLGVPYPIGSDEEYGNTNRDLAVGDLRELRVAAGDTAIQILVRTTNMDDPDALGVLLLADTGDGGSEADPALGLPEAHRFDTALLVGTGVAPPAGVIVAADPTGWTNTVEISVPASLLAPDDVLDLSVITGAVAEDGTFTPHNIAFRHAEPVDIYNDRLQAFALHGDAPDGSHLDDFSSGPVALADLRGGRTQSVSPGPGYHERHFESADKISFERGKDGRWQPYGLFIPSDYDASVATPTTFWLHYRGGKAHSGATINPRLIHELAREDLWGSDLLTQQGNVVVTPHARGTSFWYVSKSHQDFFEVFDDVHRLVPNIDPQRRYLSGYSMGGYGTYLLGLLYPDLFAAGYSVSGAVTQGAWTGLPDGEWCEFKEPFSGDEASPCYIEANSGDAAAQLTYRLLDNARHYPLHIDHGSNDELVPVSGVQRMAQRLVELGYRVQMQTFPGYEHFSQAAVDEWVDGAEYLQRHVAPVNPRQVTYRVVPALVTALNTVRWTGEPFTFDPDGAYWVDDIEVRGGDFDDPTVSGLVDLTSNSISEPIHLPVPVAGVANAGHSTPYVRYGQSWASNLTLSVGATPAGFTGTLSNVAALRLDTARMGIDLAEDGAMCGTVYSDGPATVTLAGLGGPGTGRLLGDLSDLTTAAAFSSGFSWTGDDLAVALPEAGTWTIALGEVTCPAGLPNQVRDPLG